MRYHFIQLSVREYDQIFDNDTIPRAGGGEKIYRPPQYYHRGAGLFSFIRGIGKQVLPFISKYILPSLYNVGSNVLKDMGESKGSIGESLKRRGIQGVKEVASKIGARQGGRKRKVIGGGIGGGGKKRRRYNLGVFT